MRSVLLCLSFVLFSTAVWAQTPKSISYQAVAATSGGLELANQSVSVRFSIIKDAPTGAAQYVEKHNPTTDAFGLFSVNIGDGDPVIGQFTSLNWSTGVYFLKVELDPNGGSNYTNLGTSRMISVPYALFADKASNAIHADSTAFASTAGLATEATHATTADNATTATEAAHAAAADEATHAMSADQALTALDDNDKSPTNELQSLSYQNGILSLTPPSPIGISSLLIQDADGDPSNEIQHLTFDQATGMFSLTGSDSTVNMYTGPFQSPGASLDFPLGILGQAVVVGSAQYTVPDGKVLMLTASPEDFLLKYQGTFYPHSRLPGFSIFNSASIIKDCRCTGMLFNTSTSIQPLTIDLNANDSYTVPTGKVLVVKSGLSSDGYLEINGELFKFFDTPVYSGNITLPAGSTISKAINLTQIYLTGYLYTPVN